MKRVQLLNWSDLATWLTARRPLCNHHSSCSLRWKHTEKNETEPRRQQQQLAAVADTHLSLHVSLISLHTWGFERTTEHHQSPSNQPDRCTEESTVKAQRRLLIDRVIGPLHWKLLPFASFWILPTVPGTLYNDVEKHLFPHYWSDNKCNVYSLN